MVTRKILVVLFVSILYGCTQGMLYTHTTKPLTTNFQVTSTGSATKNAAGSTKHIHIQLQATWDSNGIGEIATKNGINKIYYADMERINILFGTWEQEYIHIYGQ
jgi:hypothetical protein